MNTQAAQAVEQVTREYVLTERDFERVRKLIHEHAGIALSQAKRDLVYSRLARRLRALALDSFEEYLDRLEADEANDGGEWQEFTNALTTNLTAFYREPHHFPLLAEHVERIAAGRTAMLWCSAASTGEEPYTMAMTMVELFGSFTPPVKILATDVDTNVLEKARWGVYPAERVEKLPDDKAKRFFLRGKGENAGQVRVRPELREMILFRQLNLLDAAWPMRGPLDVIFCRNVMIYFDKPTQIVILERFAKLLRPDGLLFAGHSESFHHAAHIFRTRGKTVYELAPVARAAAEARR
ncbi:MAG: chemotaxis protein CheR [Betaproteobacteria bacterium]|nr:chemotaxis protein CheR [Betaproteobacteria bacterium]